MEVKVKEKVKRKKGKIENIPWLNPTHPNFERWKRARDLSIERGKYVLSILLQFSICENLNILDLGSGEGGTSKILSEKNNLISFDISLTRLKRQDKKIKRVNGSALNLPFKKNYFDLIILQDVIEHVSNPEQLIESIIFSLKKNGIIYLSTPNKISLFNIISDPHWGSPIISLLKRKSIKKYYLKYFRKDELNRTDIPQLFSLKELEKLFQNNYIIELFTKHSVKKLLEENKGIVWSDFHLLLIKIIKIFKLNLMLTKISNDKKGIINKYFTPTFYLIMSQKFR